MEVRFDGYMIIIPEELEKVIMRWSIYHLIWTANEKRARDFFDED